MENATQALMIAGLMLISVIVLSVLVMLFSSGAEFAQNVEEQQVEIEVAKFNAMFEEYFDTVKVVDEDGKIEYPVRTISIHELISVVNFAKSYNTNGGISLIADSNEELLINVIVDKKSWVRIDNIEEYLITSTENITEDSLEGLQYQCTNIEYNSTTGRVDNIYFKKI